VQLKLELESTRGASAQARDQLRILESRLGERTLADLLLVVTELVSNSVKFGPGGQIDLRLEMRDDGSVAGLVFDGGAGGVAMRETDAADPGGFGLQIVDQIASDWGVRPRTTDVWFELSANGRGRARTADRRRVRSSRAAGAAPAVGR
jgi:two-component sensor histidine kinase